MKLNVHIHKIKSIEDLMIPREILDCLAWLFASNLLHERNF